MQVKLINHSCVLIKKDDVQIICDPWIEGKVFDNGWDLIVPSAIEYKDFKDITHIWFSHEHPDHFFPPNIKKISPEHKKNITVVFQETIDKRVYNYCQKNGFKAVIELKPDTWLDINDDLKVMCENYTEGDSWLALKSSEMTVLNTNDCEINNNHDAEIILKKIGGSVDILLAQFSYACWAGNKDQTDIRKAVAKSKLDIFLQQINAFTPEVAIPIASYVWFCHKDNFYLNDLINKPDLVEQRIIKNSLATPVVLFPGETHRLGQRHDNKKSIKQWLFAYDKIQSIPLNELEQSTTIEVRSLQEQATTFVKQLKSDFGLATLFLKPASVYLIDHKTSFLLSLNKGLLPSKDLEENCDISLSSDSLLACMKFPWGNDTLGVNGKFSKPANGNYSRYYNFFRFNQLKSRGIEVNMSYLLKVAGRKFLGKEEETSFYS